MAVQLIPHLRFELKERGRKRPLKKGLISAANRRIFAGTSADNNIVIAAPAVPRRFLLLEPAGRDKFYFYFTDQMQGIVVRDGLPLGLDELVSRGIAEKSNEYYRVELDINDEVKLKWGAQELWLKLAMPFPKELKRKVEWSFEIPFMVAVAFSLLFHGLVIAYFNTRPVSEGLAVRTPEEEIAQLAPEQMEIPEELMPEEAEVKPAKEEKGEGVGEKKGPGGPGQEKGPAQKGLLAVLTSKGKRGVVKDLLTSGFDEDIADALGSVAGVQVAKSGAPSTRGGGGNGGASTVDIGELGEWGPKKGRELEEVQEHEVKGGIEAVTPEVLGDLDRNIIASKVMRYLGSIRWCYEQQLRLDPQLQGKVNVRFTIGVDGKVSSVEIIKSTLGNPDVESCMVRRIKRWRFPPPKEGEVVVNYPFVFTVVSQ